MKVQGAVSGILKAHPTIFLFEEGQVPKGYTLSRQQAKEVLLLCGFEVAADLLEEILDKLKYLINLDKTEKFNLEVGVIS